MAAAYLNQFMRRRSSLPVFTKERDFDNTGLPNYHYTANQNISPTVIGQPDFHEILTVDPIDLTQSLNFSDITEVGDQLLNARSVLNYAERSDNSFEVLTKLGSTGGGTASGTALLPAEHFLLERLFGRAEFFDTSTATTNGGMGAQFADPYLTGTPNRNAIRYSFKYDGSTFQIAQVVDTYMLKVAQGSYISGGSMEISREGAMSFTVNTRSAKIQFAGTTPLLDWGSSGSAAVADDEIELKNAEYNFFSGCEFFLMNSDGKVWHEASSTFIDPGSASYDPFVVAGINGNVISLVTALAPTTSFSFAGSAFVGASDGSICAVPVVQTFNDMGTGALATRVAATQGEVVPQGTATIFLGDKDITLSALLARDASGNFENKFLGSSFSMNIEKNLGDPGVQELTGDLYPAPVYVAQEFTVSGSMGMVLRPKEVYRLNRALDEYEQSLAIVIDPQTATLADRHVIIFMPRVRLSFSSNEVEGAEGANIDWFLTRPATATSDKDVFEMYIV